MSITRNNSDDNMSFQKRAKYTEQDYSKLNLIKQIQVLENYRGYKKILFIRQSPNTYLGYLDNEFFGYELPAGTETKYWFMEAKEAVDYYLDKTFFHIPTIEYDTFIKIKDCYPYITALKYKLEKG